MLNICSVNVYFQDAHAHLRHISFIHYLFSAEHSLKKNWLRKLKIIALPVYFMVFNFDYNIQLSIIHVSKDSLMPVTFYSSVVILRGGIDAHVSKDSLMPVTFYSSVVILLGGIDVHVSKYCLMTVTFYSSVVILRGGG